MSKEDFQVGSYFKPSSDEVTKNSIKYDWLVREIVDNAEDYFWLADRMAELYSKVEWHGCVCSARASIVNEEGGWSEFYSSRVAVGARIDEEKSNPLTGNSFWIGFNYGH